MRSCPDCATTTLFSLTLGDAAFAKCTCGGAWFTYGQLDRLLGKELSPDVLGGETSRRCPDCTLTMTPVVLPGGIPVETCSACRGTWLDWPDIVELRLPALERLVRPADPKQRFGAFEPEPDQPAPLVTGFDCAKCGARRPFTEGNATSKGLVCGACVAKVQPMPRVPNVSEALPDLLPDDEW